MHYYQISQCAIVLIVTAIIQMLFIFLQYQQFKKFKLDSTKINEQLTNIDAVNQSSQPLNKREISSIQNTDLTQNINILDKKDGLGSNDIEMEFLEDRDLREDIEK